MGRYGFGPADCTSAESCRLGSRLSYLPGRETGSAHQMAAGLDLHILVVLSADLAQLERGAHLTIELILLLGGGETNETAMSSQAGEENTHVKSHFLTSDEMRFPLEKRRRFLSLHPVTQQKPVLFMSTCTQAGWNACGLMSHMKQMITLGRLFHSFTECREWRDRMKHE